MCVDCWKECGSPKIDTPDVTSAAELIGAVYNFDDGIDGGDLHIVVDDFNVEDACLESCKDDIGKSDISRHKERFINAEFDCYYALKKLSPEERISAIAMYHGYW